MLSALLTASLAFAEPGPAPAHSGVQRVLVRESIAPALAPGERVRLENSMLATLEARSIAVAKGTARADARACETQLCLGRTGATHHITHWVRAEIDRDDRDYHLRVTAGRMGDGMTLAQSDAECLICGVEDVTAMLAEHTAIVIDDVARVPVSPPPPVLVPRSPHDEEPRRVPGPAMRPVGIGLLVAGSMAAISGAVLLGVDGQAVRRRCDAQAIDADGDCRYVHQTQAAGIAMISSSVLALAGGITLVTIAKRRRVTVLRARITPNRIALAGRF